MTSFAVLTRVKVSEDAKHVSFSPSNLIRFHSSFNCNWGSRLKVYRVWNNKRFSREK